MDGLDGVIRVVHNQLSSMLPNPTRTRILNDPYYRLKSIAEINLAAKLGVKIDVNQATVDDWLRLPIISIHQARLLVSLTQSGVHFYGLQDIADALKLPAQTLKTVEPLLDFYYYEPRLFPTRFNINQVSVSELLEIPSVNRSLADDIVAQRNNRGDYRDWVDFQHRLSLSPEQMTELLPYLKFDYR